MTAPFIEGRCYFTAESIVELCQDYGGDEVMVGYDACGVAPDNIDDVHWAFAWIPRYVVAALIFGEDASC